MTHEVSLFVQTIEIYGDTSTQRATSHIYAHTAQIITATREQNTIVSQ